MEHHQLKTVIGEIAGALLNEYLQIQGVTDWCLVKKYVDLLEIVGIHPDHHTQRFALLELLYAQIENNQQNNSPP